MVDNSKQAQEIGRKKQTLANNIKEFFLFNANISKKSLMVNLLTNNLLDCTDASFISCFNGMRGGWIIKKIGKDWEMKEKKKEKVKR